MLDTQVSPEEIKSREVELGLKIGLLLHQLFPNSGSSYGHCLCDSVPYSSWDSNCVIHYLLHNGEADTDTALTSLLFWRRSTASLVFWVGACD